MAVTPEVRMVLDLIAAAGEPPIDQQTPDEVRQGYDALSSLAFKEEVASVEDRTIPGPAGDVPVRAYVPVSAEGGAADARPGALVYFHGGGWVLGGLQTHDSTCRALANTAGVVVVSVEYRLAPEARFPAAVDDALAAVRWVAANAGEFGADGHRLAVGGDSAGGNLAAVVAQQLRDDGPDIRFQLLVYPVTDIATAHPSLDENADGYFLTRDRMTWFIGHYLDEDGDRSDPRVSPLQAPPEALAGLPPALVVTAEHDPLRDEGEAYGQALRAAGVEAVVTRYDGMIHGFFSMPEWVPEGRGALVESGEALRKALHRS